MLRGVSAALLDKFLMPPHSGRSWDMGRQSGIINVAWIVLEVACFAAAAIDIAPAQGAIPPGRLFLAAACCAF